MQTPKLGTLMEIHHCIVQLDFEIHSPRLYQGRHWGVHGWTGGSIVLGNNRAGHRILNRCNRNAKTNGGIVTMDM